MTEDEKQILKSLQQEISAFQLHFFNEILNLSTKSAMMEYVKDLTDAQNRLNDGYTEFFTDLEARIKKLEDKSLNDRQYVWEKTDTKPWYRQFLE